MVKRPVCSARAAWPHRYRESIGERLNMNKIRYCAAGLLLLLPGSFFVIPVLWLWRLHNGRSRMISTKELT